MRPLWNEKIDPFPQVRPSRISNLLSGLGRWCPLSVRLQLGSWRMAALLTPPASGPTPTSIQLRVRSFAAHDALPLSGRQHDAHAYGRYVPGQVRLELRISSRARLDVPVPCPPRPHHPWPPRLHHTYPRVPFLTYGRHALANHFTRYDMWRLGGKSEDTGLLTVPPFAGFRRVMAGDGESASWTEAVSRWWRPKRFDGE